MHYSIGHLKNKIPVHSKMFLILFFYLLIGKSVLKLLYGFSKKCNFIQIFHVWPGCLVYNSFEDPKPFSFGFRTVFVYIRIRLRTEHLLSNLDPRNRFELSDSDPQHLFGDHSGICMIVKCRFFHMKKENSKK